MRALSAGFGLLFWTSVAAAQAPATRPSSPPDGNLAQLMRGIMFPNSNIIFDVQTNDPGVEKKIGEAQPGSGALALFANLYTGWDVVENAAIALAEAPDLIMKPGRLCTNGKPVPVERADFAKFAQGLREAAKATLKAAQEKNQEKVSDMTNQLADACVSCHQVYRNSPPGGPRRCVP
jgi:hypothetical protein